MTIDALLAIVHHLSLFALLGTLVAERVLLLKPLDHETLTLIGRIDMFYGISAGVLLTVGLLRANFGAKGWAFYSGSPLFWIKLGAFALMGIISIYPTLRFIQWRRASVLPSQDQQRAVVRAVSAQLHLILLIPVLAVLMARGVGFRG
jgi:putative membrane protein